MRVALWLFCFIALDDEGFAAKDVRVDFTLNTTDEDGSAVHQRRHYDIYRPDNLPKTTPVPMILIMSGSAALLHHKADQAGFVVAACSFAGNSKSGKGWNNGDPRITGADDYDYITEVIRRIRASDNCNDAFTVGFSTGGHMSLAYACQRPSMIKAASSLDEFMGAVSNIPSAPLPIIMFHGTSDNSVPYTMAKDTADVWRTIDGLLNAQPITTYESSPLIPGKVSQATWRGGVGGSQVAFVTVIGGTHTYPTPEAQTGYDFTDGLWTFFSQFLSPTQGAPKIVSQPANNIQSSGQPASFWVAATGSAPLLYQWQKNGVDIPGATSNWFTVTAGSEDNGAVFRTVVRNAAGRAPSTPASLTVNSPPPGPAITIQPADAKITAGQPVSFTVAATGTQPLSYQWKKHGVDIPGATAATLTMPAALFPDSGMSFVVVVTDQSGSTASRPATLSVTPAEGAPVILENPERARVQLKQEATFSVTARSPSPLRYQWQKSTFTGNMTDIAGATKATYKTPPVSLGDTRMLFRCVVSNSAGNAVTTTDMLLVSPAQ